MSRVSVADSPWRIVLRLVERFEDALVITWLFEYRDAELVANGRSIEEVLDSTASERAVGELLAQTVAERTGGAFHYTDLYRPTRGALDPTAEEVDAFVKRCADASVELHYTDGRPISVPSVRP